MEDLLAKLKIYLKITNNDEDNLLSLLLETAGNKLLERLYPYDSSKTVVPVRYQTKQIEIALFLYNKQGAEGQTSHNENGINRTYENADIPESLLQGITPFVGVI